MRKRLISVGVCILTVPLWFSASPGDKLTNSAPFSTVAYAGHTVGGGWCADGSPGCINDLSQDPAGKRATALPDQQNDPGSGMLVLALAFLLWIRLRA